MSSNPYEYSSEQLPADLRRPEGDDLADRGTRFVARFLDGLIGLVITAPVMYLTGYFDRAVKQQVGFVELGFWTLGGFLVYLAIHGYFLATNGQTIGKKLLSIKIVDKKTGELLPFVKLVGLRDLTMIALASIPFVGPITGIVDVLFIFGSQRQCLHDLIAGTKVVKV